MSTPGRKAALDILRALRRGMLADRALDRATATFDSRERAWTQELVWGTLRFRGRVDHYLAAVVNRALDAVDPDVLDVLRLGAYQLLEMGSVPVYAAISESVDLAKEECSRGASGLVNAALRRLSREIADIHFPDPVGDPAGFLATWHSHPRWLVDRWIARFGVEETTRLVQANNARPLIWLVPLNASLDQAEVELAEVGVSVRRDPEAPGSLALLESTTVTEALRTVSAVIQDPSATAVARFAAARGRTLDLCAAPGGKALIMSTTADTVTAVDESEGRVKRLRENVRRVEATNVEVKVADARTFDDGSFDVVLVDAPCSGTGTLARHPDGRWRIQPDDVPGLAMLQLEILTKAATQVGSGGRLVYATCTLELEENEGVARRFLAAHSNFVKEDMMSRRPGLDPFDGAFAVAFRRSG